MLRQISPQLKQALYGLKKGEFVLLHDSESRENEVDMVIAAQHADANAISSLRNNAGGLICAALENSFAKDLGLTYMHNMLFCCSEFETDLKNMIYGITKYGDHPTFSISVNHIDTRTGITDADRALTVKCLASIYEEKDKNKQKNQFISTFRTPGHVPLLIAAKGLLQKRQGHTELSVFLMKLAGLEPVSVICEMLDSKTHKALSLDDAKGFAKTSNIPIIDASEIIWLKDCFPWSS
jgi:3,4-dihydroxy 2-butanone 4-phosphate synthase